MLVLALVVRHSQEPFSRMIVRAAKLRQQSAQPQCRLQRGESGYNNIIQKPLITPQVATSEHTSHYYDYYC